MNCENDEFRYVHLSDTVYKVLPRRTTTQELTCIAEGKR